MEDPESSSPVKKTSQDSTIEKAPRDHTRDHTFGMLCHLLSLVALLGIPFGNILGPLVIWLVKKQEDPFADRLGKDSLNFQISVTIYALALSAIGLLLLLPMAFLPFLGVLIFPLLVLSGAVLFIGAIVLAIIASIRASEGKRYQYPFTINFLK